MGCGSRYHPKWCNVDLVAQSPEVIEYDIRKGLPFDDNSFEAVYHSHILEHLTPEQGKALMAECQRVLAPGGVMRIVVPDLEQIASLYLETLNSAWQDQPNSKENYEWMKLELLDQMVRQQSGGLMGPYMIDGAKGNRDFVQSRIGLELESCQSSADTKLKSRSGGLRSWLQNLRHRIALRTVTLMLGNEKAAALQEGLFRQQGEIHRWMYDRFSLRQLCEDVGFHSFEICAADSSSIADFASFQLDMVGDRVRKPDSLFAECRKRAVSVTRAA